MLKIYGIINHFSCMLQIWVGGRLSKCLLLILCREEIRDSQINKCNVVVISSCQIINSLDMLRAKFMHIWLLKARGDHSNITELHIYVNKNDGRKRVRFWTLGINAVFANYIRG